jgi:putative SOS response-associated peptidase YedK
VQDLSPRYNIAPSQSIAAIRVAPEARQREFVRLHWGLIPPWAKDRKIGYSTINARAETVDSKPSFRSAFKKRRCLILADGFYEWQKSEDKKKQPFHIHMKDNRPFAFAGLWERWKGGGEEIESCTIIVTEGNDVMKPIHDRMPVILDPADYGLWLDPEADNASQLRELLQPYAGDDLEADPVSTLVNSPKNDVAACVELVE